MADKTKAHAPQPRKGKSSGSSKSNMAKLGLLGGLLVVLVIVVVVMYLPGDDPPKRRGGDQPIAAGNAPAPPPVPAPAPEEAPQPEGDPTQQPDGGPDQQTPPQEGEEIPGGPDGPAQPVEQPSRPEDVADWKGQDFYDARKENDPRLIEAVALLASRAPGSPKVAENLGQLLQSPEKEEGSSDGGGTTWNPQYGGGSNLTQALVAALGANGSDLARTILGQVLAGTLQTDDDKTAVDAALKALADYPSAKNDEMLFLALTAAEKLRPQPKGEIGAAELREAALKVVGSTASDDFRSELARYLIRPTTPQAVRDQMGDFLEQQHPGNVGAQLILYQSDQTPQELKATFEGYFTAYSSAAMGHVLGIRGAQPGSPVGGVPGGGMEGAAAYDGYAAGANIGRPNVPGGPGIPQAQSPPADPDAPFRRAGQMWSAQTVAMIEDRLGQLASLQEQAGLALLAGTMPVDSTRAALWTTLHEHWEGGSAQLESAGLLTNVITDPGMLLIVKTLPRRLEEDPAASPAGSYRQPRDQYQRENRFRTDTGSDATAAEAVKNTVEQRLQAEREWMKTSERLVRAWCERFHAAGMASPQGGTQADTPINLHPQARVVSEYHLNWPGDLGGKLSGIAPGQMEIHYLRIEDKADPIKLLGRYRRQLDLEMDDIRTVDNGSWLDRIMRVPKPKEPGPIDKTGWRRSVDILVTFVEENPERERGEEADLVVQILSIEMKDPGGGQPPPSRARR